MHRGQTLRRKEDFGQRRTWWGRTKDRLILSAASAYPRRPRVRDLGARRLADARRRRADMVDRDVVVVLGLLAVVESRSLGLGHSRPAIPGSAGRAFPSLGTNPEASNPLRLLKKTLKSSKTSTI